MKRAATVALTVLAVFLGVDLTAAEGPVPTTTATTSLAEDKRAAVAVKAPTTVEEIEARRKELAEEMAALRTASATQPAATQPIETTTQPADVATNLYFLLKEYDNLLQQQKLSNELLEKFKSEEGIRKLKEEVEALEGKTKVLEGKLASQEQAREEVGTRKDVAELYDKLNQEHDSQVRAQTARVERQAKLAELRRKTGERVAETRKAFDAAVADFTVRTTTAKAGPEREQAQYAKRIAVLTYERALADSQGLNLEESLLAQEQRREARRLSALQPYVKKLREWMNALDKAEAESELARIDKRIAEAKTEWERTYWGLAKAIEEVYKEFEKYDNPTRDRYPESQFGKDENRIARREKYWKTWLDSLVRRSGQEVLSRYRDVRKELAQERAYYDRLNDKLDDTIDERETAFAKRDQILEQVERTRDEMDDLPSRPSDVVAEKLLTALDERQKKLTVQMSTIESLQNAAIDRLTQSIGRSKKYVEQLERARSNLYWSYLVVRDEGLVRFAWKSIRQEWKDNAGYLRVQLEKAYSSARKQLSSIPSSYWLVMGALLVVSVPLSWHLGRSQRRWAVAYEAALGERMRQEGIEAAGFSERLRLAGRRLVAETAIPVLPLLVAVCFTRIVDLQGDPSDLALAVLLLTAGVFLAFGLNRALFLRARPRFRLVRCSNTVARYYRRWLRAFIITTIVLVPAPLMLYLLDVMAETRGYLWQVYKTASLVVVLLFLFRKQMVMKVVGRPENLRARWLYTLIGAIYPLLPLGVMGLLVLQMMGYGALSGYLIRNTVLTFSLALVVSIATSYVADLARKYRRVYEQQRQEQQALEEKAEPAVPASDAVIASQEAAPRSVEPDDDGSESEFLVGLTSSLFSWVIRLCGLLLMLRVWGITLVEINSALNYRLAGLEEQPVTLWRVLAALLAVLVSVLGSRSLRSILNTRVYPAYEALDRGGRAAINTILHYFLVVFGIYAAMQLLHVELGALTVLVGTLGLGLGLGLQPLFINFISGLMIFFERHIKVGDIVEVGGKIGEVTGISIRSTSIKTFDNIDLIIPNGEFITAQVVNWSLQDRRIRGQLDIGVAYGSDVELVRRLLMRVAYEHPKVLRDPAPIVWFMDFADNALLFKLLIWFEDLSDRMSSLTELRFAINKAFAEKGINIPFPQRTISMIDDKPLRVELSQGPPEGASPPTPDGGTNESPR
ncbi:MAG: mechanosensitive ion channel [Phycisphaerae bacterium]|nr:mechanosensitive ion channel [Phycisphaerae bacterium]